MARLRVGVLRGGLGDEYDVSLKTGWEVICALPQDKFDISDIFIDKKGSWYVNGLISHPVEIANRIDVAFNALHGQFGEDGRLQKILENLGLPFTGSGSFGSALAMNKKLTKKIIIDQGIKTPKSIVGQIKDKLETIVDKAFKTFSPPWIVKPNNSGSSVGISLAGNKQDLFQSCQKAFESSKEIIIEEYICGREATLGVIDNFRGQDLYTLPPVEIKLSTEHCIFDFEAKYSGQTEEICPGRFSPKEVEEMSKIASAVHKKLFLNGYSRSDFIISPQRGVYFLEVNSLPGLTSQSLFPKSLEAIGCDLKSFIEHQIDLSLKSIR
ncbi:MAG TPA: D-alanine--D-alanine ligase [Candidatus Vogelbacteria bacterium]|nr:D-alanine--D-alanine ligase [Candidatus Vogelbacteria bacterium]